MPQIGWEDFEKVELRVGTVTAAVPNEKSRKPAYILTIDLGAAVGVKTSSAQIADRYSTDELIGKQVLCVCNFAPKRVAGTTSEVLVTGVHDRETKVVLAGFDYPVPNGARLC